MIRVLIVDDHPIVREGLSRLLARRGLDVVGQAADGEEGTRLAAGLAPDVVVWDLAMPAGGVTGLSHLKRTAPGCRVLVVTALDDPWLAAEAARAGADGFLAKTASPEEFIAAIRACAEGRPAFPSVPELSPREEEVFALLGQGLANRDIAARLGISPKTVESHLERLKEKLGCASATELRALALRHRA
ncbi:MAG: response regulator transcription factor [Candidatus Acetothermia bacterium]|jgi:two-component system response regulator NreC|nr:response regulator transcription factor [Candidatus Acetothermia bacterium]